MSILSKIRAAIHVGFELGGKAPAPDSAARKKAGAAARAEQCAALVNCLMTAREMRLAVYDPAGRREWNLRAVSTLFLAADAASMGNAVNSAFSKALTPAVVENARAVIARAFTEKGNGYDSQEAANHQCA